MTEFNDLEEVRKEFDVVETLDTRDPHARHQAKNGGKLNTEEGRVEVDEYGTTSDGQRYVAANYDE